MDTKTSLLMNGDQRATLVRLRLAYLDYQAAGSAMLRIPYAMLRKTVGGRDYLYEMRDRHGNGRSLGRWSENSDHVVEAFKARRAELRCAKAQARRSLDDASRAYRWSGLPLIDDRVGSFFRALEKLEIFGRQAVVIGSYSDMALKLQAGELSQHAHPKTIQLAWHDAGKEGVGKAIANTLRQIEPTFIMYSASPLRARNAQELNVEVFPTFSALPGIDGIATVCSDGRVAPIYYHMSPPSN